MKTWLAILPMMFVVSCSAISTARHELDSIPDDQLASYLEKGANKATTLAVRFSMTSFPDRAAQIQKDGVVVEQTIRTVIVPAFTNAPLGTVGKGAIDVAVSQLSKQLSGSPLSTLVLVADTIAAQVPLPTNPADKLSPRLQKAIAAFFLGLAEGLDAALNIPPPAPGPSGSPGPGAPPPPPK